jgi:hypothetical protein
MRYFTVQEANAFIPALQATFGYIQRLRQQVVQLVGELESLGGTEIDAPAAEGLSKTAKIKRERVLVALAEIRRLVQELESHGLIVKQLDGLVDFRSLRGSRPVFLSWRKGEDRVDHWHEVWSDSDSRQMVDQLQLFPKPLLN